MEWLIAVFNSTQFQGDALAIGVMVITMGAIVALAVFVILIVALFPARFDIHLHPIARWTKDNSQHKLQLIVGIGSRRKLRWFFGFMLFDPQSEADFVPKSRILAKKRSA